MGFLNLSLLDLQYGLGLFCVFIAVCLFIFGVNHFLVDPMLQKRHLHQRIKGGNKKEQEVRAQIFKAFQEAQESPILLIVEKITGWGKIENLQRQLLQADIYINPGAFLSMVGIMGIIGFLLGMLANYLIGAVLALVLGIMPVLFLQWKKRRKTVKFEKQMPDAMELLARSMRAGHTLAGTLDLVSQETPPPLGTEMRITYEEQRLGLSMGQALRRMGERVASRDLRYFVTAVLIQAEAGGNLAEILENIGNIIRERLKLKAKVRGLTAEGRFSAIILAILPVATFALLYVMNRKYVSTLLFDPLGLKIMGLGITSIIIGALVMKKMVTIKV
jgi:tight adherence protein B